MSDEDMVTEANQDSELDLELETEETQDTDDSKVEEESETIETVNAKLEQKQKEVDKLYARLKQDKPEKKPVKSQAEGDSDWKQKMEFVTTKGRDLDAEDIDEVIAIAKGKGITYEEALDSNVIKNHLKVKQARAKIANAIPPTSGKARVVNNKTWSTMTEAERKANHDKMWNKKR